MTPSRTTPPPHERPRPRQHPPGFYRKARLRRNLRLLRTVAVAGLLVWVSVWGVSRCTSQGVSAPPKPRAMAEEREPADAADGVKIGTFLGNAQRRYYGKGPVPERLDLIWKARLGSGWTNRKEDGKPVIWSGTGWTGQPALVRQDGKLSLVVNAYDHNIHRLRAEDGTNVWEYGFDDVIKSSVTVIADPTAPQDAGRAIVTAGSRRGLDLKAGDPRITPYRAVSFATGKELWRMQVPRTKNYSQDVDASGLFVDGALFQAVESGYVFKLDPFRTSRAFGKRAPIELARSRTLWEPADVKAHNGEPGGSNLCIEASPALLGGRIYIASGAGHVYGLSKNDLSVDWDFRTGSDIDGTTVVTRGGKLLVAVEKQYVKHGGVYMLDPSKPAKDAVVWWFPTEDRGIAEWAGGVVGSVGINDTYDAEGTRPALAAFNSVDGNLYVVSQDELAKKPGVGPHGEKGLPKPKLVFRDQIGGGISTPVMVDDYIVTTGYDKKVHVYRVDYRGYEKKGVDGTWLKSRDGHRWFTSVRELDTFTAEGPFESTPIVWKGRIYVGCRDGYLYCLGDKRQTEVESEAARSHGD